MASPLPDPSSPDADRVNGAADGPPEEQAADTESVGTVLRRGHHRQLIRQIRDLTLALAAAEQRERCRIARLLHDHLQPLIHGARMWAETGRDAANGRPTNGRSDDALGVSDEPLAHIIELLDEALQATRTLSVDLHPPVLRSDGLGPALEWLADHMAETHGLTVDLVLDPGLAVPNGDLRILLFAAVRELLFNVVKHARTRSATLTAEAASVVRIEVADAGCGFDPSGGATRAETDGGLGLASVCKRIQGIGGSVRVDAAPGRGTCIGLHVPLPSPVETDEANPGDTETGDLGPGPESDRENRPRMVEGKKTKPIS